MTDDMADIREKEMDTGVRFETSDEWATENNDTLISIKNLNKTYVTDESSTVAIEDFSLEIEKGELISIVGPSGCGKTTLLRMIAGLLEPSSGSISINGKECKGPGPDRGMVFQDYALFPWRSVRKNVEFGMEINGMSKEDRTKEKAIFLDEVWQLIGSSSNSMAAEFVLEIFKIIRGYGGSAVCATQDLSDFFSLDGGKYGKGIINNAKTKIILNLEDDEAMRVQDALKLTDAENNITVEFKASDLEKQLITTDRYELSQIVQTHNT